MELILVPILAVGIVFGVFCGWVAAQKGYGPMNWFILGVFFSLLALIAIAGAPTKNRTEDG